MYYSQIGSLIPKIDCWQGHCGLGEGIPSSMAHALRFRGGFDISPAAYKLPGDHQRALLGQI